VALGDHDPLQACADAMMANSVHDRWLGRRLPALVRGGGFDIELFRSQGFVETTEAEYILSIIERGADILRGSGNIGDEAAALKAEAHHRAEVGAFFGHIAYVSLITRKPS
jgi:hypothetical protein